MTYGLEGRCSIQLSYWRSNFHKIFILETREKDKEYGQRGR